MTNCRLVLLAGSGQLLWRASCLCPAAQLEALSRQAELADAAAVLQQLEQELARLTAFVAESGWVVQV